MDEQLWRGGGERKGLCVTYPTDFLAAAILRKKEDVLDWECLNNFATGYCFSSCITYTLYSHVKHKELKFDFTPVHQKSLWTLFCAPLNLLLGGYLVKSSYKMKSARYRVFCVACNDIPLTVSLVWCGLIIHLPTLMPGWKIIWATTVLTDRLSKNMSTQANVRNKKSI